MLSEEVFNASLDDGNAEVEAKGLRTLGGLITSMVPGLSAGISPRMGWGEAVGKPRR
jgi:hypothetical protein